MADRPLVVHEHECRVEEWNDSERGVVRWRTLMSSDRTPTSKLTLGIAELEPGESKRPKTHRHEPVEAYYILSGTGVVEVDGKTYDVRPGTAVFVPGGVSHGASNTGSEPLRLLFVFPVDSFDQVEYVFDQTSASDRVQQTGTTKRQVSAGTEKTS